MNLRTCVDPSGKFIYGIHKPGFKVLNMREKNYISSMGESKDGRLCENRANFPPGDVEESCANPIFEIPNPFPFRGVTYIAKRWADEKAKNPFSIMLPEVPQMSFTDTVAQWPVKSNKTDETLEQIFQTLPLPLKLAIATTSTDPEDLIRLARNACEFIVDGNTNRPVGLRFQADERGNLRPVISDRTLFEAVANNRFLPDDYKEVMALRPGIQGNSEIVGEWTGVNNETHVFEYLRRNSYIPWGHYAANMAHDAVRYRIKDLTISDMTGMRHLYYQRTYVRVAEGLDLPLDCTKKQLSEDALEDLRQKIIQTISVSDKPKKLKFSRTLWGWNFGFDFAPSRYRLHASHQQVHQQFALVPETVSTSDSLADGSNPHDEMPAYACGDLIADFISRYRRQTGRAFFGTYISAIRNNQRMDGKDSESSLIIYQDPNVMLFVPKAQTSQWEIQLMTLHPVGNILEADTGTRKSLDAAILLAMKVLEQMGAKMITSIEYSKSFHFTDTDHRLLYCFLPRLPESPGAFSEAQLRWINGHYPEDFAAACRSILPKVTAVLDYQ